MTSGENLLNLTIEYRDALDNRALGYGEPAGREPAVIAAEYETALLGLLARQ